MTRQIFALCLLWFANLAGAQAEGTLSLEDYLQQVQAHDTGIAASRTASQAARDRVAEGDLLFSPRAFAEAGYVNSKQEDFSPLIQGSEITAETYKVGVEDQTRYGLKAKLSSELDYVNLQGFNPQIIPVSDFHSGHQSLELTQSLLRNGFGSEVRALERLMQSQARSRSLSESFKTKVILAAAEMSYWRLAAARESVQVKTESLERATKIRDWNRRRDQLDLGRRSDVLQAEAAVKLGELDLQAAQDDARVTAWNFNTARGSDTERVDESLQTLEPITVEKLAAPSRKGIREDLKAAEESANAATANAELAKEKNRPTLDLSASLSLNGLDSGAASAYGASFSTDHPTTMVGVKFAIPLNFGLVSSLDGAYRREAEAAKLDYEHKKFDQDREWQDLERKLTESKKRLALAQAIESAQQEKYRNEKSRHDLGRTTTYQVLTFQQDYASAELTRIQLQADVLELLAQMKLYTAQE